MCGVCKRVYYEMRILENIVEKFRRKESSGRVGSEKDVILSCGKIEMRKNFVF